MGKWQSNVIIFRWNCWISQSFLTSRKKWLKTELLHHLISILRKKERCRRREKYHFANFTDRRFTGVFVFLDRVPNSDALSPNVIPWCAHHHSRMALLTSQPMSTAPYRKVSLLPFRRAALCISRGGVNAQNGNADGAIWTDEKFPTRRQDQRFPRTSNALSRTKAPALDTTQPRMLYNCKHNARIAFFIYSHCGKSTYWCARRADRHTTESNRKHIRKINAILWTFHCMVFWVPDKITARSRETNSLRYSSRYNWGNYSKLKMLLRPQVYSRLNAEFPKCCTVYPALNLCRDLSTSTGLFADVVCKCIPGFKSHRAACEQRGLSDRLGYNLICIADRVISIRVTTQSSLPTEERTVCLKWAAHPPAALSQLFTG